VKFLLAIFATHGANRFARTGLKEFVSIRAQRFVAENPADDSTDDD
jgi:hypothetical protein